MASVVKFSGNDVLLSRLGKLLGTLENPTELWDAIGFAMSENTKMRITDQVDVDGRAFVPSYRAERESGQTLLDRGLLRNSITYFSDKRGVEWGVPAEFPYAWILNDGGVIRPKSKSFLRFKIGNQWVSKKSVTIPKRQFVGMTKGDEAEVLDIVGEFLKG